MPAQPPKPGHQHLHIRDVPLPDVRALKRAAALAEPPTSATQLIRDLIHARAMQAQPGPATGYRFTLDIHADVTDALADQLLQDLIWAIERHQLQAAAGKKAIDDNGNPVP